MALPMVPQRQEAADLAVGVDSSPWERLGFYEKEVMSHLEETQEQLKRLSKVKVNALRATLSDEFKDSFEFQNTEQHLRKVFAEKIQEHRASLVHLATLIGEILSHRQKGDAQLVSECSEELEQAAHAIKKKFQSQKKFFLSTLLKQEASTSDHLSQAEAASCAKWTYGCVAAAAGFVGLFTSEQLWHDLRSSPSNGNKLVTGILSALADWCMRLFKLKHDNAFPHSAIVFYPVVPISMTLGFAWSFWCCLHARSRQKEHLELRLKASADTEFVRANEEMWTGMNQLVDALWDKVKYLEKLNKDRRERVNQTLRDIGEKTFNMVMSVDVYMIWMERHNIFPPNVSVSVIMGKQKYRAIYSMLNPRRRWFRFGMRRQ